MSDPVDECLFENDRLTIYKVHKKTMAIEVFIGEHVIIWQKRNEYSLVKTRGTFTGTMTTFFALLYFWNNGNCIFISVIENSIITRGLYKNC